MYVILAQSTSISLHTEGLVPFVSLSIVSREKEPKLTIHLHLLILKYVC